MNNLNAHDPVNESRILRFLHGGGRYLVLGHRDPDGDCVCSQIVLKRFLLDLGADAVAVSAGPFDRPEIRPLASHFAADAGSVGPKDRVVLLDCPGLDRTGLELARLRDLPVLVIDHHGSASPDSSDEGKSPGGPSLRCIDPRSPSTTLLLFRLLEAARWPIDPAAADLLLFGFCTDTGFFRHLDEGHGRYMPAVGRLMQAGASPQSVYSRMHGGRELEQIRRLAEDLGRVESHAGGRILMTWSPAGSRGSDELYRQLTAVRGVELAVLIRDEAEGSTSIGLRSTGRVDVGRVASRMGGGGHRGAAGYSDSGSFEAVKKRVLSALTEEMERMSKR